MKYTVKPAEKSTVKINITLNAQEWENAQKKAYDKTKGKYSVPGFRKGKVPKNVIEQMYGKGVFFEEAINVSFSEYYFEILDKETSIEPIDRPDIDIEKIDEKGITMVAIVPVKPEVTLGEYKGITIDKVEYNVTKKDVDAEIDRLVKRNAREVNVEGRPCQNGDITVIDYKGTIDGVAFNGGTAEGQTLELGSGAFIPGFEDGVVGMNIGDEKDINVKFPDNYGAEELKGKDAVFTVKLHEIKVKELPEVTDEFIKEATGEESLDAFKKSTKAKLKEANDKRAKAETEDKIIEKIAETSTVEIPDAMVERQIDAIVQDMEYRMMYQGLRLEDFLKYSNQSMEDYRNSFRDNAQKQVKLQLVVEKIIKTENITVDQAEIDEKIKEQAKNMGKDFEEYKKSMNDRQLSYFENNALIEKMFAFLTANNKID
ncbi:MAG: trigger factor [Clostridiales bacterium]|nr:trigger factor [Clostridiales bacterium]